MKKQNIKYRSGFVSNSSSSSFILCYDWEERPIFQDKFTKENFPTDLCYVDESSLSYLNIVPMTYKMYELMLKHKPGPLNYVDYIRCTKESMFMTETTLDLKQREALCVQIMKYSQLRTGELDYYSLWGGFGGPTFSEDAYIQRWKDLYRLDR